MTSRKQILKILNNNNIPYVIIGGVALRIYNSPRITHDIDISINERDIKKVIKIMYQNNYFMITAVEEKTIQITLDSVEAEQWVKKKKANSITFIYLKNIPNSSFISFSEININSQIDFLFRLCIPFPRLKKNAIAIDIDDIKVLVCSLKDLLVLKKARNDKTNADYADIEFLEYLINS